MKASSLGRTTSILSMSISEKNQRIRVTEIFYSLQGESRAVGLPTVFIRLTGCPLRCKYCDTAYAFQGGAWKNLTEILADVAVYKPRYVTVTGGEPLAQKDCILLLKQLCDVGYNVSLETSGALDVSQVDKRVVKVMDLKTPSSAEQSKNRFDNIKHLNGHDQIKFVIADRDDYDWSVAMMNEYSLVDHCEVLFSPVHQTLPPRQLAEWVLLDRLAVRVQIQMHKYLWGNEPGH